MKASSTAQTILDQLFVNPSTPDGAYPFDQIKDEHFAPTFRAAIAQYRAELATIIENPEPPTFANTIVALEEMGSALEAVEGVFFNLLHANSNAQLMALAEELSPELTALGNDTSLSPELFERIRIVYEQRESLNLDEADRRLLENCYDGFTRQGALLPPEKKEILRTLREELSLATLTFGNHVIKEENAFSLYIDQAEAIAPLPQAIREKTASAALEKGHKGGYLFDLSFPCYTAIMKFCPDPNIRQQMYLAKATLCCHGGETDNRAITQKIVNHRLQIAQLLGYKSYADYALEKRMLNTPEQVMQLLTDLRESYKPTGVKEMEAIEQLKGAPLEPWDVMYYIEQYREQHYAFSQEELRPYFPLHRVIEGVFGLASRLYDISFIPAKELPIYHPDVLPYRVQDNKTKQLLGLLYLDFFPREGKRSGAWMNNLKEQRGERRPHILLVMNFTQATKDLPSLLSPNEVNTFLHEFGHGLHGLLTQSKYTSLSGTNVTRDFVELPSQLMENWLLQPEFVKTFALHFQTNQPLPEELLGKMIEAEGYPAGYNTLRQLSFGLLDMAYHTLEAPLPEGCDLEQFERDATASVRIVPPAPKGCMGSTSFGHLFSGGYAAGYYGYKWSEVLDADAFSLFQEKGIFNPEVAQAFRTHILEKGDLREAMELYVAFRGRKPEINALLKRDHIL